MNDAAIVTILDKILTLLEQIAKDAATIAKCCSEKPVTGITVVPGPQTTHAEQKKEKSMKVTLAKKSAHPKHVKKLAKGAAAPVDFKLADNGDDTCTVYGLDAAGDWVDISALATLAVTSSDTTKITVDPPSGMTFAMHAVGPLTTPGSPVSITAVATWTAGGVGPFTFTLPVDVVAGAATGIVIVPGTPTVH